jgi:HEAT repeat protein
MRKNPVLPKGRRLLEMLTGGDRRSIGRANQVAALVLGDSSLLGSLVEGLENDDALVRMRAADALEKVTIEHPEWLTPYKQRLLRIAAAATQQEVRWHMAQLLPRLALTPIQRRGAVRLLMQYRSDASSIVRTFALQALVELSPGDEQLRRKVVALLRSALRSGTPALRSRARRLLRRIAASGDLAPTDCRR